MAIDYYEILTGSVYYDSTDLRFNSKYNFLLSNQQLIEFKKYKTELIKKQDGHMVSLDLKSYNSSYIFYTLGECLRNLQNTYMNIVVEDMKEFKSNIFDRNFKDIMDARVYSELEGSMQIENVPTTRTRLEQIKKGEPPQNKNEIIARNMIKGIDFIMQRPEFNKENLYALYNILSKDCLDEDQELNGYYYRNGAVYISKYEGCPYEKIDECMTSMFDLVERCISEKSPITALLPHICHYYLLYVHPYFDYNGRTARMVSLWIGLLTQDKGVAPLFISEAINDDKKRYYSALSETRDMDNDLTYFIIYILNTSIRYALMYGNLNHITDELLKNGVTLTHIEKVYIKKILLGAGDGFFDYKKFLKIANIDITKQAALKALNKLVEYGVLSGKINDKKVKLFMLNKDLIKYSGAPIS